MFLIGNKKVFILYSCGLFGLIKNSKMHKVTNKNTKTEILEAYSEALQKLESISKNKISIDKKKDENNIIQKAMQENKNNIIKKISEIKINTSQYLDDLEKKLLEEKNTLDKIIEGRILEEKKLKDLYNINYETQTLESIINAAKEKKIKFEEEEKQRKDNLEKFILEQKKQWDIEHANYKKEKIIQEEDFLKKIKRKEEEYDYQFRIKQQKNDDAFILKKNALEQELGEKKKQTEKELSDKKETLENEFQKRENYLKDVEEEFNNLKKFKSTYEDTLKKELKKVEDNLSASLKKQYEYDLKYKSKEYESQNELLKQKITLFEDKLNEKNLMIKELNAKAQISQDQSQNLAKSIVDNITLFKLKEKYQKYNEDYDGNSKNSSESKKN